MKKLSQLSSKELNAVEMVLNGIEGAILIDENGIIKIFTDHYEYESGMVKTEVLNKKLMKYSPLPEC